MKNIYFRSSFQNIEVSNEDSGQNSSSQSQYTAHVPVPSQKDIEEALLKKKKQELLEKYGCLDVKSETWQ